MNPRQGYPVDLMKGDGVLITDGAFENFNGFVEEIKPLERLIKVRIPIFDRSTEVDLEYGQVEKI